MASSLMNMMVLFEDYLFHEGIQKTACTETPGQLPIEKRVKANIDIIKTFINF